MNRNRPKDEQILEWFESPVTEYFFALISGAIEETKDELRDQGFDTVSAEQLQARRGTLFGMRNALEDVHEVFADKSFSQLEEEEDGEQVGDSPEG